MTRRFATRAAACLLTCLAVAAPDLARACAGVGVITRIDGLPQGVIITRVEDGKPAIVVRPRILEVVCQDDLIHAVGTTAVFISLEGRGLIKIDRSQDYRVAAPNVTPNAAGNAYRTIGEKVMPDMKRLPWNVTLQGGGDDFGFALPALTGGGERLQSGRRPLLVRLVGGTAPYKVEIVTAAGVPVAAQSSAEHEVVFPPVALSAGAYEIRITDSSPGQLRAPLTVVDSGPPAEASFEGLADPEVRAAAAATALARANPGAWSFEAEQLILAAPSGALDRDRVYELVESYTDQ